MSLTWIKCRCHFADGPGDWEWHLLPPQLRWDSKLAINEYVNELFDSKWEWSEHYRGNEYKIDMPPVEVVVNKLSETRKQISALTSLAADLVEYLEKCADAEVDAAFDEMQKKC